MFLASYPPTQTRPPSRKRNQPLQLLCGCDTTKKRVELTRHLYLKFFGQKKYTPVALNNYGRCHYMGVTPWGDVDYRYVHDILYLFPPMGQFIHDRGRFGRYFVSLDGLELVSLAEAIFSSATTSGAGWWALAYGSAFEHFRGRSGCYHASMVSIAPSER